MLVWARVFPTPVQPKLGQLNSLCNFQLEEEQVLAKT